MMGLDFDGGMALNRCGCIQVSSVSVDAHYQMKQNVQILQVWSVYPRGMGTGRFWWFGFDTDVAVWHLPRGSKPAFCVK